MCAACAQHVRSTPSNPRQRGPMLSSSNDNSVTSVAADRFDAFKSQFQGMFPNADFPTANEISIKDICHAMDNAEQAQQQLLITGRFAEAARQGNRVISNLFGVYSTLQQLYHKAIKTLFLQYGQLAVTPEGLGYAVCCDVLQQPLDKQPGDTMSFMELTALRAKATMKLAAKLAKAARAENIAPEDTQAMGWMTFSSNQQAPTSPAAGSPSTLYVLPDLLTALASDDGDSKSKQLLEELLFLSCTAGSQAVLQPKVEVTAAALQDLISRGLGDKRKWASCLSAALRALPPPDLVQFSSAEAVLRSTIFQMRGHPRNSSYLPVDICFILENTWAAAVSTGISHVACSTMLEQLEGSRPLHDWGPVLQLLTDHRDFLEGVGFDMVDANRLQLELVAIEQQQGSAQGVKTATAPAGLPRSQAELLQVGARLEDLDSNHLATALYGQYTQFQLYWFGSQTPAIVRSGRLDFRDTVANRARTCSEYYVEMFFTGDWQAGVAHMLYYLDIQQLALQHAGGQTGPAARAAALELMGKLPHSVVVARAALRCANTLMSQQGHLNTMGPLQLSPDVRAAVLARGDPRATATVLATQQLPEWVRQQASSPYQHSTPSAAADLTAGDATLEIVEAVTKPGLTHQQLMMMLSTAGSPGSPAVAFDPALSTAFNWWLERMPHDDQFQVSREQESQWFAAAVVQVHLSEAAGGDEQLAALLLGPGAIEQGFLRAVAEFYKAKQQTSQMFAQAVCDAGWALTSKAAQTVAKSHVLCLAPASQVRTSATMWLFAAVLAGAVGEGTLHQDDDASGGRSGPKLCVQQINSSLLQQALSQLDGPPSAHKLLIQATWFCYSRSFDSPPGRIIASRSALASLQAALAAAGGSYHSLDPAAQALLQGVLAFVLRKSGLSVASPILLPLLEQVPLLHAEDYRRVLQLACRSGTPGVFSKVWSAAVAAATDLKLAAVPAFGAERPNVPWLVSQMEALWLGDMGDMGDMADVAGSSQVAGGFIRQALQDQTLSALWQQLLQPQQHEAKKKGFSRKASLPMPDLAMPDLGSGAQQQDSKRPDASNASDASDASVAEPVQLPSKQLLLLESNVLLQPVLSAAERLLHDQHQGAAGNGRDACDAASQLISGACTVLSHKPNPTTPVLYTAVLKPAMQQVLALLRDHKHAINPPPHMLAALAAAVHAGVAAGDLSLLHSATTAAADLQLTQQDLGQLQWAAVAGAAARAASPVAAGAAAAAPHTTAVAAAAAGAADKEQLLSLWSEAVQAAPASMSSTAADTLVAALTKDAAAEGQLCQHLLQEPPPAAVLTQLLLSACSMSAPFGSSAVMQQLLEHTLQHELLLQLKPQALAALLQYATADRSLASREQACSVLKAALQHGKVDISSAVVASLCGLLQESDVSGYATFAGHMTSLSSTPAAPAVQQLVCQLLCGADALGSLSWQLFDLLTELGPVDQVPQQQQLLQACKALLQQQEAGASSNVLSVWQVACKAAGSMAAAVEAIGSRSCQRVLSSLVAAGHSSQALAIVQQEPSLLPQLAQLWQQKAEQQQQPVGAELLLQALQLCAADGSAKAAVAADLLLQQLEACKAADAVLQQAGLLQQLMQVLCQHTRLSSVLQLLRATVQAVKAGSLPQQEAVPVLLAAVTAVTHTTTQQTSSDQQQQLVQLLSSSQNGQQLAQAAVATLLQQAAPAAAPLALLLHALQSGEAQQPVVTWLQEAQLERLCALISSAATTQEQQRSGMPEVQTLLQLPGAASVAAQCVEHTTSTGQVLLSVGAAAHLINALAAQHPELQPSTAAEALGIIHTAAAATGPQAQQQQLEGAASAPQLSQMLAAQCYQQLQRTSGVTQDASSDSEDLEASLQRLVAALTDHAAAAALCAVWAHRGQQADQPSSSRVLQAPAGLVVPLLCLALYLRAKPTGDLLVFDLGLAAAAEAAAHTGDWHKGEGIIAAAKKALQHAADGTTKPSKRSQAVSSDWIPALPAAQQALLSVLVHTEGAEAAGQLLSRQHAEQVQGQQQGKSTAAAAGRKGKAATSARQADGTAAASSQGSSLLTLPVIDSFLTAAVSVVRACQQEMRDEEAEAAAQAAVQVSTELFKQQLIAVSMGAAAPAAASAIVPGATTWAFLVELYGVLGSWQQTASIVLAAVKQQLPGVSGLMNLQVVLAGAASACNSAGQHVLAVQLLDGLLAAGGTTVALPGLAQHLMAAAEADDTAMQELSQSLVGGEETLYDGLPELAALQPTTAAASGVFTDVGTASQVGDKAIQLQPQAETSAMKRLQATLQALTARGS